MSSKFGVFEQSEFGCKQKTTTFQEIATNWKRSIETLMEEIKSGVTE